MEVCVPYNSSSFQDISSKSRPSTVPINHTQFNPKDLSMRDLETCLTQYLKIDNVEISSIGCNLFPKKEDKDIVDAATIDGSKDTHTATTKPLIPITCGRLYEPNDNHVESKCFWKCVTFPLLGEPKSSVDGLLSEKKQPKNITAEVLEESSCAKSANQSDSQSVSLSTPLKLVSAVKGSREKQGVAPKKLSVTWAPDVYDPTPTSVSHVPSSKNHRNRNDGKKHGKNKQKGGSKSSRVKSKEKKQHRKTTVVPVR